MMAMSAPLHGSDVVVRLALTVVAGVLFGYNRSEHGKAAGMRTTLLVCLAASVAMLQVNALLPMAGRQADSFVMNDLMRLPLGILTGVGFIGGGAILQRRDDAVVGVTTAATLWLVTVIGLCLGGGQLALGAAATVLGLFALWVLRWAEDYLRQERTARFAIEVDASGPGEAEIRRWISGDGLSVRSGSLVVDAVTGHRTLAFRVREMRQRTDTAPPALVDALARQPGVIKIEWHGGV